MLRRIDAAKIRVRGSSEPWGAMGRVLYVELNFEQAIVAA